jgi:hypothetical protein
MLFPSVSAHDLITKQITTLYQHRASAIIFRRGWVVPERAVWKNSIENGGKVPFVDETFCQCVTQNIACHALSLAAFVFALFRQRLACQWFLQPFRNGLMPAVVWIRQRRRIVINFDFDDPHILHCCGQIFSLDSVLGCGHGQPKTSRNSYPYLRLLSRS